MIVPFQVVGETPRVALNEAPSRCAKTPEEAEESGLRVTPQTGLSPPPSRQEEHTEEQHLQFLVRACSTLLIFEKDIRM